MVYKRKGRDAWFVAVPTRHGWVKPSTGTSHKPTAKAIGEMLEKLGPKGERAWDLLDAVADGLLTLGESFDRYSHNDLPGVRASLADVDLEPHVSIWLDRIRGDVAADTAQHYEHMVRSLLLEGQPFLRSRFTAYALYAWLSAYPASRSTRRKAHSAMSGFAKYLKRAKVLATNPMRDVDPPPASAPRLRYLDASEMLRLANSQAEVHGVLSALLGGSGIEVSVALNLKRRDVDIARREIRAAGTKTHARDRIVRVADGHGSSWKITAPTFAPTMSCSPGSTAGRRAMYIVRRARGWGSTTTSCGTIDTATR